MYKHDKCKLESSTLICPQRKCCITLIFALPFYSCQVIQPWHELYATQVYSTQMNNLELAIGSILVTIEHKRMDTHLEYRDLPVLQNCLRYLLSCFYPKIHLQDLFYISISANSKRIYLIAICLSNPSKDLAILCKPCSWKLRFFLPWWNNPVYTQGPLGCLLGFWLSGPKPCGGNRPGTCVVRIWTPYFA